MSIDMAMLLASIQQFILQMGRSLELASLCQLISQSSLCSTKLQFRRHLMRRSGKYTLLQGLLGLVGLLELPVRRFLQVPYPPIVTAEKPWTVLSVMSCFHHLGHKAARQAKFPHRCRTKRMEFRLLWAAGPSRAPLSWREHPPPIATVMKKWTARSATRCLLALVIRPGSKASLSPSLLPQMGLLLLRQLLPEQCHPIVMGANKWIVRPAIRLSPPAKLPWPPQ